MAGREEAYPEVRIHTFGSFAIERLNCASPGKAHHPPGYLKVPHEEWHRRNSARVLLKVLLSRPRRRGPRDVLLELLCPDPMSRSAGQYLDSAASILRSVLRDQDGKSLLTTIHASEQTIYQLADQQRLWVDAEAVEIALNEAAKAESEGHDPLPFLEGAYELARGEFLEEELYSDWAQGWRQRVGAARTRCLHWLAALYMQRGLNHQAEVILQASLADDLEDEDVLCRLMFLLAEQGRSGEALRLYERSAEVLRAEKADAPSPRTQELAERIRINPYAPGFGPPQVQSGAVVSPSIEAASTLPVVASSPTLGTSSQIFAQQKESQDPMDTIRRSLLQALGVAGISLVATPQEVMYLDPWERLSRTLIKPSSLDDSSLAYLDMLTRGCWQSYFAGQFSLMRQVLPGTMATLTALVQEESRQQKAVARLASQTYQIAHLYSLQHQDFGSAHNYAHQALLYATLSGDPDLQVASLVREARVHFYLNRPEQMVQVFQNALQYKEQASPLLRGRVYIGLALGYSKMGQKQEALHYHGLARETFPERPENDPSYSYTHFSSFSLLDSEGLTFVNLKQPKRAWDSFQKADKYLTNAVVPDRVELAVRQATTLLALEDQECCTYVAHAATLAKELGVTVRYYEALGIYQKIPASWRHDQRVKELATLFSQEEGIG